MPQKRRPLLAGLFALTLLACSAGKGTDGGTGLHDGATGGDTSSGEDANADVGFDFDASFDTGTTTTPPDAAVETGGGVQDAKPDVASDGCSDVGTKPGPGPYTHACAPKTDNECDGKSDKNAAFPNGANGNGFDDDCDGLVDEGCTCDAAHPPGTTKP